MVKVEGKGNISATIIADSISEEWKDVTDFEGLYQVSTLGSVRSLDRLVKCSRGNKQRVWKGKLLNKVIASTRGYEQVSFSKDGTTFKKYVHRLVAETFLADRNETVNHKDGNKLNNCISNLEWVSHSDNQKHAYHSGLNKGLWEVNSYNGRS